MSGVRGAIFDLDGTIAETHPMAIQLIGEAIVECGGADLTPERLVAMFGPNEKGIFRLALGDDWGAAWDYYLARYVDRHQMCPEPFPGIRQTIESLAAAGCHLAVVTGKTGKTGRLSLDVLGLSGLIPEVRGGSMDGVIKREEIITLVQRWDVSPGVVVYVGDSPADVTEAHAAGVVAVGACWSAFSDPEAVSAANPDQIFTDVSDFARWIAQACADDVA